MICCSLHFECTRMDLISFLKNNLFMQNLAARMISAVPCVVEHNIEKYKAIKKAMYLTALEQLPGDYLEFGVFTGSSFVFAMHIHRKLQYLSKHPTKFYGFDSFEGFGEVQEVDTHPFYTNDTFRVDANKVISNIKKQGRGCQIELVKGYFNESIKGRSASSMGIEKSRVIFIDCDLKAPSAVALEFIKPTLQQGTILIMDDFYSYKGDPSLGVCGAFEDFNRSFTNIEWRRIFDYGYGGAAFILARAEP